MKIDAIYSYDVHSEGAKALAKELEVKIISHVNSKFVGGDDKTVLNWGCSDLPRAVRACQVINPENGIRLATNKLFTFRRLSLDPAITLPKWTDDQRIAATWKERVYCRTKLTGHDGAGLVITEVGKPVEPAKLYTAAIGPGNELREYRINIFRDHVVSRQKKVQVRNFGGKYQPDIKTTGGGYGFDVVDAVPLGVIPMAKAAVKALGLDIGGVDVAVYKDKPYILEVNTAPQLTPFTCQRLAKLLKDTK